MRAPIAALATLLFASGVARANGVRILVVDTGEEPSCLAPSALAEALARHGRFPAQVVRPLPADPGRDAIVVSARDDGARVTVRVLGAGRDLTHVVDASACDTLTEEIAAYVASAVAPSDEIEVEGRHDPAALTRVARDELARGAVDLRGLTVEVARAPAGYSLSLSKQPCRRERFLGALPGSFDRAVAVVVTATVAVLAEANPCGEADPLAERAVLLADSLAPKSGARAAAWLELALGALIAIGGGLIAEGSPEEATTFRGASAVVLWGGAVLGLLLHDEAEAERVVKFAAIAGGSLLTASLAWRARDPGPEGPRPAELREAYLVAGAAGAVVAWLVLEDAINARDESRAEQRRLRARIDTPAERARLTPAELRAAERELSRASDGRPAWHYAAPLLVGGLAELGLATLDDGDERTDYLLTGAVLIVDGLLVLLLDDAAGRYRKRIERLRVEAAPLPSGAALGVRGSF